MSGGPLQPINPNNASITLHALRTEITFFTTDSHVALRTVETVVAMELGFNASEKDLVFLLAFGGIVAFNAQGRAGLVF